MLYFGFLEQVHHGETSRRNMGGRKNAHRRYCRWRDKGIWESLLDSHGMPVRFFVTEGTAADCNYAASLIEGIDATHLLADRGYDSHSIVQFAKDRCINPVIIIHPLLPLFKFDALLFGQMFRDDSV